MSSVEVLVRTYKSDGTFYKGGWTDIRTLWVKGYHRVVLGLVTNGKCRITNEKTGSIVEFIEV